MGTLGADMLLITGDPDEVDAAVAEAHCASPAGTAILRAGCGPPARSARGRRVPGDLRGGGSARGGVDRPLLPADRGRAGQPGC